MSKKEPRLCYQIDPSVNLSVNPLCATQELWELEQITSLFISFLTCEMGFVMGQPGKTCNEHPGTVRGMNKSWLKEPQLLQ